MTTSRDMPSIHLRAIEPEDLDMLYKIENDMDLWNVSSTNVPYSKYILHDYVANTSGDIYSDKQVRLMVMNDKQENVGIVDLVNFNPQHRRAEIGIVIQKAFRQQGYAKAAMKEIMRYSLKVLHLHQIYSIVDTRNTQASALFHSLGFKVSSELKDWLYDGKEYHNAVVMQTFL